MAMPAILCAAIFSLCAATPKGNTQSANRPVSLPQTDSQQHESIPTDSLATCHIRTNRLRGELLANANTTQKDTLLLDLSYGMEQNEAEEYTDSVLDIIPGLIYREYSDIWKMPDDTITFTMSLGIYLDKEYPSDTVRETVFRKLNEVIPSGFYDGDLNERQTKALQSGVSSMKSADSYLNGWQKKYDKLTRLSGYGDEHADYFKIVDTRGCAVAHKVYEDSEWATYIIELSYSYHSSCGCPSWADYYTINKKTGKILTLSEFLEYCKRTDIESLLRNSYEHAATAIDFEPIEKLTGAKLLEEADGVALINDGALIYFHPYKIGCGGEGQYNLIIPVDL